MQTTLQVGESVINLEYQLGKQMVVFSHGFAVRGDSRGLFTDIVKALPRGWGYVLFDFDQFDSSKNELHVIGFAERLRRLQAVIDWTVQQDGVGEVHAIGHSLGAVTLASLAPAAVEKFVLLAPPLVLGLRFAERFTKRETTTHEGHTWTIPRSDGTTTIVDDEQLAELVNVDAEGELSKLAMFRPYAIVMPGADEVEPDADYTGIITLPSIRVEGVERADHDFSGDARPELVDLVQRLLKEPVSYFTKEG
jgi:pimeloyl-ACP methyl ester carboxylesterase